jgi:RNA polymerase sigma factor (sigma-70 family)
MPRFETTRWSVVARARGTTPDARTALEALCRAYRPPVVAYIRARGYSIEATEDLAQNFFERFLEDAYHSIADPARGRFRAFLLTALKRFLINSEAEARTLKRGGAVRFDAMLDDSQAATNMVDDSTPEREFERGWVIALVESALNRLRDETEQAGKGALFLQLKEFLSEAPDDADYARAAAALNMRRNTVAVAVHRLRHRLRELVRDELMQTTTGGDELAAELQELRAGLPVLNEQPRSA